MKFPQDTTGANRTQTKPAYTDPFEEFNRFFSGVFAPSGLARTSAAFAPAYEMHETEKGYLLSFDIPGIPAEDVRIEVKEDQLRISGERKATETIEGEGRRVYSERRYGRFERVFALPSDVDTDKIEAHHEHGVLQLNLPKMEKVKARTIQVQTGKGGSSVQ